ncbi:ABC transporter substrate-binding protein [Acidisoma silvae]|uniref:ABC transporter substrate-binding protein n=1 Tax=Acidisoma silvae TaxID=2802396 RepID=A0A963YN56_9PROT|nr:ABC transporter substrate-binding protein [Acidisoma silvae]MCB8873956.1 ABC transporter substrate-binding protein [Acidisoma silvae]
MAAGRRSLLGGLAAGLAATAIPEVTRAATPQRKADDRIVMGALFPLTGPLATLGNECLRGVQLATDLCNAGGGLFGKQINLVQGDAADPDRAVAAARSMISDQQPVLIFGTGDSALSLGASEASEGSGVPYWELSATMPSVTTRGFHYLLRICDTENGTADRALEAAQHLIAPALGRTTETLSVTLLYSDGASGMALLPLIAAAAQRRGMAAPMTIAYQSEDADFTAVTARLAAMQPDVLIHFGSSEDVVLLHAALANRRWRPRAMIGASSPYGSRDTAMMVGPAMEGTLAIGVAPYSIDARLAPDAAMVATLYEQQFGAAPRSGLSLSHFAGAGLCFDTLRLAKTTDKDKVLAVVQGLGLAEGTLANGWGALFGPGGQNLRAFTSLAQWQNGRLVSLLPKDGASGRFRLRV